MENALGVRGDLIRWARQQQGLTMRDVNQKASIALGYQSEVENGKKREVSRDKLDPWVKALAVTEAFLRGEIRQYTESRDHCRGLAGDVLGFIHDDMRRWAAMGAMERMRQLLNLIATRSIRMPRTVLAWTLRIELLVLDGMIDGSLPITQFVQEAVADLTGLPSEFIKTGSPDLLMQLGDYGDVVLMARERGITPEQLKRWILSNG